MAKTNLTPTQISASKVNVERTTGKGMFKKVFLSQYFILILSVLFFMLMVPIIPKIANPRSLDNMLQNILPLFIIAVGQMFVLIVAGIDLSQTSIIGLTSVVGAIIMTNKCNEARFASSPLWNTVIGPNGGPLANSPWATPVAILVMISLAILIGLLNGICISKLKMPPFMVTLVTSQLFLYVGIWSTQSFNIISLPESFLQIGRGSIWIMPYALLVAAFVGVIASFILRRMRLGRWLYATGANSKAARVSGVPTDRVVIFAYIFSAICCAIASVIYSGRLQQGSPTLSRTMLMDIIGATVIGGTSMFGGKGKVSWVLIGSLFFTLLLSVLNMLKLSAFIVDIVKGLIILVAALLDVTRARMSITVDANAKKEA